MNCVGYSVLCSLAQTAAVRLCCRTAASPPSACDGERIAPDITCETCTAVAKVPVEYDRVLQALLYLLTPGSVLSGTEHHSQDAPKKERARTRQRYTTATLQDSPTFSQRCGNPTNQGSSPVRARYHPVLPCCDHLREMETPRSGAAKWFEATIVTPVRSQFGYLADAIANSPLKGLMTAEELHTLAEEEAKEDMAAFDADGDNRMDFAEFCTKVRAEEKHKPARLLTADVLRKRFDEIDKDGSGFVDFDEYVKAMEQEILREKIEVEQQRQKELERARIARKNLLKDVPPQRFHSEQAARKFFSAPFGTARMNMGIGFGTSRVAFGSSSTARPAGASRPMLPNNAALAIMRSQSRGGQPTPQASSGRQMASRGAGLNGYMGFPGKTRM